MKHKRLTYREFEQWCQARRGDGKWGFGVAILCLGIISDMDNTPRWKRWWRWRQLNYQNGLWDYIVKPINQKIEEYDQSNQSNQNKM